MREYMLQYFNEDLVDKVLQAKKYYRIYGEIKSPLSKYDNIDINICITLYEKYNLPIYKVAMLYGVSDATMRTYLKNNNVVWLKRK